MAMDDVRIHNKSHVPACGLVRGASVGVCVFTSVCEREKMKVLSFFTMIKVASEQL